MDRTTKHLLMYCEQQALHHELLRLVLFGVPSNPAYYYQVTVSLGYHSSSINPQMQSVCADLQHHLLKDTSLEYQIFSCCLRQQREKTQENTIPKFQPNEQEGKILGEERE